MSAHADRPYPFAPLEGMLVGSDMCAALKVSATTIRRYREFGLTERQADRLACRVGIPAVSLWPEIIDAAIADHSRTCAADGCEETFPAWGKRRYCCGQCMKNQWQRDRYRDDPEFRARRVESARRYHAENGDYVRSRQRRYERENPRVRDRRAS